MKMKQVLSSVAMVLGIWATGAVAEGEQDQRDPAVILMGGCKTPCIATYEKASDRDGDYVLVSKTPKK